MIRLSVNIDHVATVRQARKAVEPDVVQAGLDAEKAGADGITVHLRADRRHIQEEDVRGLKGALKIKLNLEMAATEQMLKIALDVMPHMVTLVPEKNDELTTQGGLDVKGRVGDLRVFISRLKSSGICVSLFIDPSEDDVEAAAQAGADFVEIHTGIYADKFLEGSDTAGELINIEKAVKKARSAGLKVNAGHGITYKNAKDVVSIKGIEEMSIGHSIISRAIFTGLGSAVREMRELFNAGGG